MSHILDMLDKVAPPKPVEITVEEWGDAKIHIMPLSVEGKEEQNDLVQQAAQGDIESTAHILGTVISHIVDKDGNQVIDPDNEDHVERFSRYSFDGVEFVYHCIQSRLVRNRSKINGASGNLKKSRKSK